MMPVLPFSNEIYSIESLSLTSIDQHLAVLSTAHSVGAMRKQFLQSVIFTFSERRAKVFPCVEERTYPGSALRFPF